MINAIAKTAILIYSALIIGIMLGYVWCMHHTGAF